MNELRPLAVFFGYVFSLAVVVLTLTCGLLVVSRGLSVEFFQALALLALALVLLSACNKVLTGKWHRWSGSRGAR